MAKKSTATKIREYIAAHPKATAIEVAKKCGTSPAYVHVIKSNDKWTKNKAAMDNIAVEVKAATPPPAINVDATLIERGKRYGTFKGHAEVTYRLKNVLRAHAEKHGRTFAFDQAEAMDMICHKLGRIVNGDPDYVDSWVDIAGYAKLVADRLLDPEDLGHAVSAEVRQKASALLGRGHNFPLEEKP